MTPVDAWLDTPRGRGLRDRCSAQPVPEQLRMLDADHAALLARWLRSDSERRGRSALMQEAGASGIERAEALCDLLLRDGWTAHRERFVNGSWQWESLTWRDLPRLQALLGVASPRQRAQERASLIAKTAQWLQARREAEDDRAVDPDLLDELAQASSSCAPGICTSWRWRWPTCAAPPARRARSGGG